MLMWLNLILLIFLGYLFSILIFNKLNFKELFGFTLLFAISLSSLVLANLIFFLNLSSNPYLLLEINFILISLVLFLMYKKQINIYIPKFKKTDLVFSLFILIIVIFSFFYYNNSVYHLSLTSYLEKGETNCFYMLAFALQPSLEDKLATKTPYDILSTPGNSVFVSPMHLFFDYNTFKYIYIIFQVLLFIFTYLIIKFLTKSSFFSYITSLFAIFNPYILSIEVLDRNVMALVVSTILFFSIFKYKKKYFLHGLLYGLVSGLGLRFLPLVFIIPIFILYFKEKTKVWNYLFFIIIAVLCFAYNFPHLNYHGLNTLGESKSYFSLAIFAFTKWLRTPFVPYPNLFYILIQIISYFGYFISSIVILGFIRLFKKSKINTLIYSLIFLIPFFTLTIQRDFIEMPKNRIILMSFLPIFIWFSFGLISLTQAFRFIRFRKNIIYFSIIFFILFGFINVVKQINFSEENEFYNRKFLYQTETNSYYNFQKQQLSKIKLFPYFKRLGNKIKFPRKKLEEKAVIYNLIQRKSLSNFYQEKNYDFNIQKPIETNDEYVKVSINFDNLVTNLSNAIKFSRENNLFIDFENKEELIDVYYKEFNISWQNEKLPLTVFTKHSDSIFLNEIYLDLNSFISYSKDEFGFHKINSINYNFYPESKDFALKSSMSALPSLDNSNSVTLNIPRNHKIIIRNWFINGANAQAFKIDSWVIDVSKDEPSIQFLYNEPESYI